MVKKWFFFILLSGFLYLTSCTGQQHEWKAVSEGPGNTSITKIDEEIALLFYHTDFRKSDQLLIKILEGQITEDEVDALPEPEIHFLRFVIWKDGHILIGKEDSENQFHYFWNKISPEKIQEIQQGVLRDFRVKSDESVSIDEMVWDAPYYVLQVFDEKKLFEIWICEIFQNIELFPDRMVLDANKTEDGHPLLLKEFYAKWKKTKENFTDISEPIISDKTTTKVNVFVRDGFFDIESLDGKIIRKCEIP